jgi:hypothetical protein
MSIPFGCVWSGSAVHAVDLFGVAAQAHFGRKAWEKFASQDRSEIENPAVAGLS